MKINVTCLILLVQIFVINSTTFEQNQLSHEKYQISMFIAIISIALGFMLMLIITIFLMYNRK